MKETNTLQKTGRRKTSIAQVRVTPGQGNVVVNAKPVDEYFRGCERFAATAKSPVKAVEAAAKYDYEVTVVGGGVSSQSGAVRHAIARAVSTFSDACKKTMKQAGFLTRDPRMVERKKPGQPKARKHYQFSKR